MITQIKNLQEYTKLPLNVLIHANTEFPTITVNTPHKGEVFIEAKNTNYPFLFGSVTQTDKKVRDIVSEIQTLEFEAKMYLLDEWLEKQNELHN